MELQGTCPFSGDAVKPIKVSSKALKKLVSTTLPQGLNPTPRKTEEIHEEALYPSAMDESLRMPENQYLTVGKFVYINFLAFDVSSF